MCSKQKMASEEETIYCICRQPYDGDGFMIECDVCRDWFHGDCVGIQEHQASDIEIYHCPNCQENHGPLVLKRRRNFHRHDYSELDDTVAKAVQTGTVHFIRDLKNRAFASADEIPVLRPRGYQVTAEYLDEHRFKVPILVDCKDGLDLNVPPPNFTIQDVENHVGSMREIDVIDVSRQEDYKMLMREWTEYYNSTNRHKVYNVISLEFSKTKLAELVTPPRIVRELSWVNNYWPEEFPGDQIQFERPLVQRYCLMGVKDSYTDFHVDFGGTSVWYHVLRGEKVFYLIRPTDINLELYERWVSSASQSEIFFGDQVDKCYKCVVKQGQTLFIPTGWIHAVLTPIDSLVFGGNFLHSYHIDLQIRVYEIEKAVGTPAKYLFPNFETIHWHAARHIIDTLKEYREEGRQVQEYLAQGAKCLAEALKLWTHKKDMIRREGIPDTIQYGRLLKELQMEVKNFQMPKNVRLFKTEKKEKEPKKEQKKRKKKTQLAPKDQANLDALDIYTQKGLDIHKWDAAKLASSMVRPSGEAGVNSLSPPLYPAVTTTPLRVGQLQDKHLAPPASQRLTSPLSPSKTTQEGSMLYKSMSSSSVHDSSFEDHNVSTGDGPEKSEGPNAGVPLKMRILRPDSEDDDKKDLSVYDFDEEEKKADTAVSPIGAKTSILGSPSKSPGRSPSAHPLSPRALKSPTSPSATGVKLKLNMGKILSGTIGGVESQQPTAYPPGYSQPAGMLPPLQDPYSLPVGQYPKPADIYMSMGTTKSEIKDEDSDDEHLVVDETPSKKQKQRKSAEATPGASGSSLGPPSGSGSLKFKLSVGKYQDSHKTTSSTKHDSTMSSIDSSYASSGHESSTSSTEISSVKIPFRSSTHSTPGSSTQLPYQQSGYNGSIADILEASGYNSGSEFKVDDQIGNASPSMRDAIQGMLTMSQMGGSSDLGGAVNPGLSIINNPDPFVPRPRPTIRLQREQLALKRKSMVEDESGEKMPTCFKDAEFVYPTLDLSDNEDEHVFKPRGRLKKDETWNPKARLAPNCPKPERPMREGVRRESVESGLAAAAARLANQPPAKRQYIRKKPKKAKTEMSMSESYSSFSSWPYDSEPGTSSGLSISAPASTLQSALSSKGPSSTSKKPKKGMATAKQRLGKILKLHKMMK